MPGTDPREFRARKVIDKVLRARADTQEGGRRSPAFAEAAEALSAIESAHHLGVTERIELRKALVAELVDLVEAKAPALKPLPSYAPELWSDRVGRKENPVAFVRRVYAPWLNRGLVRGDLRALDPSLYQALAVWMHRHPDEPFSELESPYDHIGRDLDEALTRYFTKHRKIEPRAKRPHRRVK